METIEVTGIDQVLEVVRTNHLKFFRGLRRVDYKLVSAAGRDYGLDPVAAALIPLREREETAIQLFDIQMRPYVEKLPSNRWELFALAQHFGVPTRFMDWTTSALVGLFFAVSPGAGSGENLDQDAALVGIMSGLKIDGDAPAAPIDADPVKTPNPLDVSEPVFYYPPHFTDRIKAQQGLFIVSEPGSNLEERLFGYRMVIPRQHRADLLDSLDRLGINERAIYPGLDTIARWIKDMKFSGKGPAPAEEAE